MASVLVETPYNAAGYEARGPITIIGNSGFTEANGVVGGTGTSQDPFIIEGWEIDTADATGIYVESTDAFLIIQNVSVQCNPYGDMNNPGIWLQGVSNCVIDSSSCTSNLCGMKVAFCSNVEIRNCTASSNKVVGITLEQSADVTVSDTIASANQGHGIDAESTTPVTIQRNNASQNMRDGIKARWCPGALIEENYAYDNVWNGTEIKECAGGRVLNNTARQNHMCNIDVESSPGAVVGWNFVLDSPYSGIRLYYSPDSRIQWNAVTGYGYFGIDVSGSRGTNVSYNSVDGAWYYEGIQISNQHLESTQWTSVYGNSVGPVGYAEILAVSSGFVDICNNEASLGIEVYSSQNVTVRNNIRGGPITASSSSFIDIDSNVVSYKSQGITVYNSHDITISSNVVHHCTAGISLVSSTDVLVYHNGLILNGLHAYDDRGSENSWDIGYPEGGNHWDNYTGEDLFSGPYQDVSGSDGIGDTPMAIDLNSRDRYPVMAFVPTDDVPPVTVADYSGSWLNETVTLEASDEGSCVVETYYRINDGDLQTVDSDGQPVDFAESADNAIEYWSVDYAGNEELPHNMLTGIKYDSIPPEGSVVINGGANYTTDLNVTLTLSATDAVSGVDRMLISNYSPDYYGYIGEWEPFSTTKEWTLLPSSMYGYNSYVYCSLSDSAGNIATVFGSIIYDPSPPDGFAFHISKIGGWGDYAKYTNRSDVYVWVSFTSDSGSGVDAVRFSNDNVTWRDWLNISTAYYPLSLSWTLEEEEGARTVYGELRDKAGNVARSTNSTILDITSPSTEASVEGTLGENGWYVSNVSIHFMCHDDLSGIQVVMWGTPSAMAYQLIPADSSINFSMESPLGEIEYYGIDRAGNWGPKDSLTIGVDKTAPILLNWGPAEHTSTAREGECYITYDFHDSMSGMSRAELIIDGGEPEQVAFQGSLNLDLAVGEHTVVVRAVDVAGNSATHEWVLVVEEKPLTSQVTDMLPYIAVAAAVGVGAVVALLLLKRRKLKATSAPQEEETKKE